MSLRASIFKRRGLWAGIGIGIISIVTIVIINAITTDTSSEQSSIRERTYQFRQLNRPQKRQASPVLSQASPASSSDASESGKLDHASTPSEPEISTESASVDLNGEKLRQRIIKTGYLQLQVKDVPNAIEAIKNIAVNFNGFIESSSITDSGSGPRSADVLLRVPVTSFEATMTKLKSIAALVFNESIKGQDVTMEFVDLTADLRNAKAEEFSYLAILKRSGNVKDVLEVTRQLAEVRRRIERLEGRKRYLENRTELATISLSLTEETRVDVPSRTWSPLEVLRQALHSLVIALQELMNFLIRLTVVVIGLFLPIGFLISLVGLVGWKLIKVARRRIK